MDGRISEILVAIATKSSLCRTVADVDDRPGDPGLIKFLAIR